MYTTRICAATLRELRLDRALSVPQLAKESGLPLAVIYRLENGDTTRPFMTTLRALAAALQVEVKDLLIREDAADEDVSAR